jgi:hypothetical protein
MVCDGRTYVQVNRLCVVCTYIRFVNYDIGSVMIIATCSVEAPILARACVFNLFKSKKRGRRLPSFKSKTDTVFDLFSNQSN